MGNPACPNNFLNYQSSAELADGEVVGTGTTGFGFPAFRIFDAGGTERTSSRVTFGSTGADVMDGGTGDDTLFSQGSADRSVYDATGWGTDQIGGFTAGARLQFTAGSGVTSFGQLNLNIAGGNTQVNHANGVILVFGASLGTGDFIFGCRHAAC